MSTNYYDLGERVLMLVQTSGGVARVRIGPDSTSNKPSIYTGYAVYKCWGSPLTNPRPRSLTKRPTGR